MTERKLVPNIRFKGFEEEWKKKKIKELGKNYTGGGTPSKKKREFWQGNIPWIQSSDLIQDKVFKLNIRKHITKEAVNESAAKIISRNSIAVVTRVGVGKLVLVPFCYSTSQDFISISDIYDDEKFIAYLLFYTLNYSQKASAQQGTSIKGITKKYFLSTQILLPNMIIEQQKIGDLFAKLDQLLDLQQQKLDQLELLKKALLQKLFPKQDAKIPELRFKGFEGEWKKVKMSQLVSERSESVVPNNQYPLMAFIAEKGVSNKGERYNRDFLVKSEKKKYKKTEYGDLIYSSNNLEVGSIGINRYGNATISPVYSIFKVNKLMTYNFLGYFIQRKTFINNMIKYRQGVTYGQWKIHESDFLRLQEIIPNYNEQQKIGNLLAKIDRLIELENKKFSNLKLVKKSLLQNMFVE